MPTGDVPDGFRIVQVVQEFSRAGGVETVAAELQQCWDEAGVPSDVLAATIGADISEHAARRVRRALPRQITSGIPTRGRWRYIGRSAMVPAFTIAASAELRRARKRGGWADGGVVLSHGDSLVADVIVLHAVNAASLAQKRRDGEWRWALNPMHLWVRGRDRWMLDGARARRYVAVSRRVEDELVEHHHVPRDRITVIPNGIDLARFSPAGPTAGLRGQFGIQDGSPLLLFAGHEFGRKGLAHLIGALKQPGCEAAHVVAVGDGECAAFAQMAAAAGVGDRVHFTGARNDLPALYREADAFVLPTAYETFSLVCMEAMACGVPVVATAVGGIEDYLRDGVNGVTITRDGASVGAAVGRLLSDSDGLRRLGDGARTTALGFAWSHAARRYRDLLVEVWLEKYRDPTAAAE